MPQDHITAPQVLEGLSLWLQRNPWAFEEKSLEHAQPETAQAALGTLLALGQLEPDAFLSQPAHLRSAALWLLADFIAKLLGPLSGSRWHIGLPSTRPEDLAEGAWRAVEHEIARQMMH